MDYKYIIEKMNFYKQYSWKYFTVFQWKSGRMTSCPHGTLHEASDYMDDFKGIVLDAKIIKLD